MDGAAENGSLEVVKWLHHNRNEGCTGDALFLAAKVGRGLGRALARRGAREGQRERERGQEHRMGLHYTTLFSVLDRHVRILQVK